MGLAQLCNSSVDQQIYWKTGLPSCPPAELAGTPVVLQLNCLIAQLSYIFFDMNSGNGMVFKLEKQAIENVMSEFGGQIFNPGDKGKPMKNWVVVDFAHHHIWEELLQMAYQNIIEEIENGK